MTTVIIKLPMRSLCTHHFHLIWHLSSQSLCLDFTRDFVLNIGSHLGRKQEEKAEPRYEEREAILRVLMNRRDGLSAAITASFTD